MSESMVKRVARALEKIADKSCYTDENGIIDGTWDSEKFARAALAEVSAWQPIESAPKDGDFWVYLASGYITRGRFIQGKHFACDSNGPVGLRTDTTPTHWQPIPEPPA